MIYTEQQLDKLSNPPAQYETQQIIRTHKRIREALDTNIPKDDIKRRYALSEFNYDVYLQGSYKNSTNIRKSSDVDVVVELTSVFYCDTSFISEDERRRYESDRSPSQYKFEFFRQAVHKALVDEFGNNLIHPDNKCIKLDAHGTYANADIVPCFTHKLYTRYPTSYHSGIQFTTQKGDIIVNFPQQHFNALTNRSTATDGKIKEFTRLFKSFKEALVENYKLGEGVAASYFIENLLYNVPDRFFKGVGTYEQKFRNILDVLIGDFNKGLHKDYVCANEIIKLFHPNSWNEESLRQYLLGLIYIRDNNEF